MDKHTHMHWTAYTGKTRFSALQELEKVINSHGAIIDFKEFSDISINLEIEINRDATGILHRQLSEIITLEEPVEMNEGNLLYLHLIFGQGTGDLRIEVPAVPG